MKLECCTRFECSRETAATVSNEAHTLIRTTLTRSGDIIPDRDTLHTRLDPLSAPRHTAAIDQLCRTLNTTNTVYPGTKINLRYSTKPHRATHTHY
ncbi:MAG TPA: hypothetical protein VH166_05615 [Mycobacterium sp.]|jgi:hypothetical protein|nr:hypothetical protein [Mycobacterium sp.]